MDGNNGMTARSARAESLAAQLRERFGTQLQSCVTRLGEVTIEVDRKHLSSVCLALRDDSPFDFDQLIDLCGVDYLLHGKSEWVTEEASRTGFGRGREGMADPAAPGKEGLPRLAVVYHLLSVPHNQRLRVRTWSGDEEPIVESVVAFGELLGCPV